MAKRTCDMRTILVVRVKGKAKIDGECRRGGLVVALAADDLRWGEKE